MLRITEDQARAALRELSKSGWIVGDEDLGWTSHVKQCPSCQEILGEEWLYCSKCGTKVPEHYNASTIEDMCRAIDAALTVGTGKDGASGLNDKRMKMSETPMDSSLFQSWHESRDGEVCTKAEKLEAAIQTAMSVLEQIAERPRNSHHRRLARAAVTFIRTQLAHVINDVGGMKTTNEGE